MSLRTKSRMPASTSVTAARLVSTVSVSAVVASVFSGRMAFIVIPLFALSAARVSPARRRVSGRCIRASDFDRNGAELRQGRTIRGFCRGVWLRDSKDGSPALLEARGQALVDRALRGFADGTGDGDVVEQLLLGAELAQPFVVIGRHGL